MTDRTREDRLKERDEEPASRSPTTDPTADDPHEALNNPADNPDPTEYPDPYDRRPDPRDPAAVDTPAAPAEGTPRHRQRDVDERAAPASQL